MIKLSNIGQLVTYNSITGSMECKENVEIIIDDNKIYKVGIELQDIENNIDCNSMLVTPGFVDSHTHPVFYDERIDDFSMRINGKTYGEIVKMGGGISSSVIALRQASIGELIDKVEERMDRFLKLGTTTIECKSGYGLNTESELKSLQVIHEVNLKHEISMVPTFMGAHAFPSEYSDNHDGYVDLICKEMIPLVSYQGLAVFNDVFCENGYFDFNQTRKILNVGRTYGLRPRLHADEFEDSNGALCAGEVKCISADHLMKVSEKGIESLYKNNVIATLLPGTTFFLGLNSYAPYEKLNNVGIDVALASDYNPGSCTIQSMSLIISLACINMGMNVLDAIKAATFNGARSLMLENSIGSIEEGKNADIIVWNIKRYEQIAQMISNHPMQFIFKNGKKIFTA